MRKQRQKFRLFRRIRLFFFPPPTGYCVVNDTEDGAIFVYGSFDLGKVQDRLETLKAVEPLPESFRIEEI